uniref:Adhesion G protein-coupled receptor E1-like n=1 Tax=Echeneis naucrates TaxID=173247 RepID=A0A665VRQ6_ECHNA
MVGRWNSLLLALCLSLIVIRAIESCQNGFIMGETGCIDDDECEGDEGQPEICGENTLCFNTRGSFYCQCADGFKSSLTVNFSAVSSATCTDINECVEDKNICGPHTNCINASPSYSCVCQKGFLSISGKNESHGSNITCRDIDECQMENVCGQNALCVNTPGSYHCACNAGFGLKSGKLNFTGNEEQCEGKSPDEVTVVIIFSTFLDITENTLKLMGPFIETPGRKTSSSYTVNTFLSSFIDTQITCERCECNGESPAPNVTGFTTVSLLSYKNLEDFANGYFGQMKSLKNESFEMNSKVVTVSVSNRYTSKLEESVNLTFNHLKQSNEIHICVFWDSSDTDGAWSTQGCTLVASTSDYTVCSCTHLSSFAVLMAVYEIENKFELQLISWVGMPLSLICLFICILTFSMIRSIQSPRTTIHLHLCISLFIAIFIFLVGISQTKSKVGCALVAGLLHFFFLAAFCWMCLEGVQLFRMVVLVFNTSFKTLHMMAAGYGVPAVIVAISISINPSGYGTERYCWLGLESIWSFFGPVCFILIINIFFFLITVWKLAQKFSSLNPDLNKLQKIKAFTITAVAQLCVLGTMWIFGCFQFEGGSIVMSYLFTIFGSLQGVLLFVMHCLFSKQVRDEYANILSRCCAPRKKFYSEFGSSHSSKAHGTKSSQDTGESHM